MAVLGIDISYYQGNIDWFKVKASGIKFAILRLGYTGYGSGKNKVLDPMFETYYNNAKAVGIPVGVYYFSRAVTIEEGISEANFVIKNLQGKKLEYPVYIDVEDEYYQANATRENLTNAIKAFCQTIQDQNFYVGIYASLYWFNTKLILGQLTSYDKWVAQWTDVNTFSSEYGMWQFSSTGNLGGINPVDLDYAYKDYPAIMIEKGLNGFSKQDTPSKEEPTIPKEPPKIDTDSPSKDTDNKKDNLDNNTMTKLTNKIWQFIKKVFAKLLGPIWKLIKNILRIG